jgi:hypothetical protein
MTEVNVIDEINCGASTYWNEIFLDEEFNRKLYLEKLGFNEYRVKSQEDSGDSVRRVLIAVPPMGDVPGALRKLLGDSVSYEERGTLSKGAGRYEFSVVPGVLADKVTITGSLHLEPLGEERSRRVFRATINAKIFGLGGVLERKIATDLERSQHAGGRFTNAYLERRASQGAKGAGA